MRPALRNQFDLFQARSIGHAAAQMSAERADRLIGDDWSGQAVRRVCEFARLVGRPFLTEEARAYAETYGVEVPPDGRAWGHVVKMAQRIGVIDACGYAAAASSNGSPKVLWQLVKLERP